MINGQKITLAQYASRMNIKLLRPADFNSKVREHSVDKKVTVRRVSRFSRDEQDVRTVLDEIWLNPIKSDEVLAGTMMKNQNWFEFEEVLAKTM